MVQSTVTKSSFLLLASVAETALNLPEPVLEWSWEGVGLDGNVLARLSTAYDPDIPTPPWWRERERWQRIPFADIFVAYLEQNGVSRAQVRRVTMTAIELDPGNTGTPALYLVFARNQES